MSTAQLWDGVFQAFSNLPGYFLWLPVLTVPRRSARTSDDHFGRVHFYCFVVLSTLACYILNLFVGSY